MKKSIKIFTEGGQHFGFGHIVRCKALYDAFDKNGCNVELFIQGDKSVLSVIQDSRFTFLDWHVNQNILASICSETDFCIIDSYNVLEDTCFELASIVNKLIVFDDTNRILYPPKTIIINGLLDCNTEMYDNQKTTSLLLGIDYQCVRKEFWDCNTKIILNTIDKILITVGANDIRNIIPRIVKIVKKKLPESQIFVIVGSSSENCGEILRLQNESNLHIEINPDIEKLLRVMKQVDFVISASGQTLCELACMGVPGISISVIKNQTEHAISWDKEGCFDFAGLWNDTKLEDRIESLLLANIDKETRMLKSNTMKNLFDGKGAIRIVEYLLKS